MKKIILLVIAIIGLTACEDLIEAIASTECYCESATEYYAATVLDQCDPGFSFECYPLGESPYY